MDKRRIAIVAGGYSSEFPVSLRSAQGIYSFMDKDRYDIYIVKLTRDEWFVELPDGETSEIDKNDFSFVEGGRIRHFDFVYITIHGTPGEDGRLQGYLDMIGLPYSTCDTLVSAMTFNKFVCNRYLHAFGIPIAHSIVLRNGQTVSDREIVEQIGLPCFIKPNVGGSSCGATKVKIEEEIQPAIKKAFDEAFAKYDVIIGPAAPTTAPKLGDSLSDPIKMYLGDIYTISVNLAGLPGISVPCGQDSNGLPIGMQIIGDCFKEKNIIRAAYTFEQAKNSYDRCDVAKARD